MLMGQAVTASGMGNDIGIVREQFGGRAGRQGTVAAGQQTALLDHEAVTRLKRSGHGLALFILQALRGGAPEFAGDAARLSDNRVS